MRTVFLLILLLWAYAPANAQTTTRRTYLELMDVQALWETRDYDQAIAKLEALAEETRDRRNFRYDYLVANQYLAQTGILADRPGFARQALETALATEGVEDYRELSADLKLLYGQILLSDEEYARALEELKQWYEENDQSGEPVQIFLLGYAYYMNNDFAAAEMLLKRAIDASTAPLDSWVQVYYQTLFEQKKYSQAEALLYEKIAADTDNEMYWRILSNHYLQLENGQKALAVMGLEYLMSFLKKPEDLKRLASLYSYLDIPEKGARLLEGWLHDETLQPDYETLRRLGDLWLMARERDKAKDYLQRAAAVAPDGKTYELLASILFEDEDWRPAYRRFQDALKSGGLEDPDRINLLAGVSAWRAGMMDEARKSLELARQSQEYGPQAEGILQQMN